MIYLDNAATTQIRPEVIEAMMPYLTTEYGNPGSLYSIGRNAAQAVAKARQQVAGLLNCEPEHIVFTSGGSEANNLVIKGVSQYLCDDMRRHVLTDKTEHDSLLKAITDSPLYAGDFAEVNRYGEVDANAFRNALTYNTGLASIMLANNITGRYNLIRPLVEIARERGILFHTDCVQAAGFYDLDVENLGCDFLSISGHKIHAPKGVGALYIKDKQFLAPLISGGEHQEFGLRGGTENVASIVGFGVACEMAKNYRSQNRDAILKLKQEFMSRLYGELTERGLLKICHLNAYQYYNKIVNVRFDGVDAQTLVIMADTMGVCLSAGSACQSKNNAPNPTLVAIGLTPEQARQSVRISFSELNTIEEMGEAARIIAECVQKLRGMSNE